MSDTADDGAQATLFVGDDLALDFLNTRYGVGAAACDRLGSDRQVLEWLGRAGLPAAAPATKAAPRALLRAALALRETALALIEARKAGRHGDPAALNRLLALGSTHQALSWKRGQPPAVVVERRIDVAEALLVPVAEAAAQLLAEGDFALVRQCESSDCTLWFHDRTRSHRRRWCSMASCGNRMKVAAFRARRGKG
jgi:predicted RNA-binding Zn ribbon-like protein